METLVNDFEITNLSQLIDDSWFADGSPSEERKGWLRLYICPCAADFVAMLGRYQGKKLSAAVGCIRLAIGHFEELKLLSSRYGMSGDDQHNISLVFGSELVGFPKGDYVALMVPLDPCDKGAVAAAWEKLDLVSVLIPALCGKSLMWDCVFDGIVCKSSGPWGEIKKVAVPGPMEWVQSNEGVWSAAIDILQDCAKLTGEIRARVLLAIRYLKRALYSERGFLDYWIACEILVEGRRKSGIQRSLQQLYGLPDKKAVLLYFRLNKLERWRNDLVHRGEYPPTNSFIYKYMQFLFLDLLQGLTGISRGMFLGSYLANDEIASRLDECGFCNTSSVAAR